jgi:hypothetical protein
MNIVAHMHGTPTDRWWTVFVIGATTHRLLPEITSLREIIAAVPAIVESFPEVIDDVLLYLDTEYGCEYEKLDLTDDVAIITTILKYS